jgi:predicted anti-sigma-YlaC factor YlaD
VALLLNDRTRCPAYPAEVAEAYLIGALHRIEERAFEEHLRMCAQCMAAVENTGEYIRAMRVAALRVVPVQSRRA